jgi:hypothetical protein
MATIYEHLLYRNQTVRKYQNAQSFEVQYCIELALY